MGQSDTVLSWDWYMEDTAVLLWYLPKCSPWTQLHGDT